MFGMILPTGDNYSDIWVSWNFFSGTYYKLAGNFSSVFNETTQEWYKVPIIHKSQPLYGFMTIFPVLMSFTLTAIHWYQTEEPSNRQILRPLIPTI